MILGRAGPQPCARASLRATGTTPKSEVRSAVHFPANVTSCRQCRTSCLLVNIDSLELGTPGGKTAPKLVALCPTCSAAYEIQYVRPPYVLLVVLLFLVGLPFARNPGYVLVANVTVVFLFAWMLRHRSAYRLVHSNIVAELEARISDCQSLNRPLDAKRALDQLVLVTEIMRRLPRIERIDSLDPGVF